MDFEYAIDRADSVKPRRSDVRRRAALALAIALALWSASASAETDSALTAALESINVERLYQHVEVLADDVYEGRAAGSRGGRAAARYLVHTIRPLGLTPAGDRGDYVQTFNDGWQNVLVVQPGYDPELQHQFIVVGAHYDHVGYGNSNNSYGPIGQVHNGADDNASGVAVLLETIEAFAATGLRTRRSILFAFWDGEERGLVGSRHWLTNPTLPAVGDERGGTSKAGRVRLAITIDMVGRLREGRLYVLGTRSGYGMRRLVSGLVDDRLWLDFSWEIGADSDHWSFLERRVPVLLLHTGLHPDYHRPSDTVEKINRHGMRDIARYLLAVVVRVANEDGLPEYRSQVTRETENMRQALERPLPPRSLADWPPDQPMPRLGVSWRSDDAEPGSVLLTRVVEGTPAWAAGLAVRDRVYEVNGQAFADEAAFQKAIFNLLDAAAPEFTMLVEHRGHLRTVTVQLPSDRQEPPVEIEQWKDRLSESEVEHQEPVRPGS